jgi:hypothetical protein
VSAAFALALYGAAETCGGNLEWVAYGRVSVGEVRKMVVNGCRLGKNRLYRTVCLMVVAFRHYIGND